MIDIAITGKGFYRIAGLTEAGAEWIDANVIDAEDGSAFTDSTYNAQNIAEGATDDGLAVEVNGFGYAIAA